MGARRAHPSLEQAITFAAHCRFGKTGVGYIARIWGDGKGPQVAHASW